ncbi:MAG TPA: T9SS type A sorting domain-containing protein, partial [Bacteroidales bacterium]|nr:T9SS type A sorting domain-containing protein [Bacteroidales bacterium]
TSFDGTGVVGTFAYDDNTITPDAGTYSAAITFTPTDTDNYNTVGGSVDVTVAKATPAITTLPAAAGITYGDALSAATLSGGATSFDGTGVVGTFAYDDNTITPDAGTYSAAITFTPTDTDNYNTVGGSVDVTVAKAVQIITFNELADVTEGDEDFQLTGATDSGLEVSYQSSNTEVATVSGNMVHIIGAGATQITASQEGNENYLPAESVTRELVVHVPVLTDDNINDYIHIYPNPTRDNLFIKGNDMSSAVAIELYNISGTLIDKLQHPDLLWPAKMDLSYLEDGYYLIRINGEGFTLNRKILKQ